MNNYDPEDYIMSDKVKQPLWKPRGVNETPKFEINQEVQTHYAEYEWHAAVINHRWYDSHSIENYGGWWYSLTMTDDLGTYLLHRQEHEVKPLFVFVPSVETIQDSITAVRKYFAQLSK